MYTNSTLADGPRSLTHLDMLPPSDAAWCIQAFRRKTPKLVATVYNDKSKLPLQGNNILLLVFTGQARCPCAQTLEFRTHRRPFRGVFVRAAPRGARQGNRLSVELFARKETFELVQRTVPTPLCVSIIWGPEVNGSSGCLVAHGASPHTYIWCGQHRICVWETPGDAQPIGP